MTFATQPLASASRNPPDITWVRCIEPAGSFQSSTHSAVDGARVSTQASNSIAAIKSATRDPTTNRSAVTVQRLLELPLGSRIGPGDPVQPAVASKKSCMVRSSRPGATRIASTRYGPTMFTKQVSRPVDRLDPSSWPPRRSRSSELEERPAHGPDPRFLCPTGPLDLACSSRKHGPIEEGVPSIGPLGMEERGWCGLQKLKGRTETRMGRPGVRS